MRKSNYFFPFTLYNRRNFRKFKFYAPDRCSSPTAGKTAGMTALETCRKIRLFHRLRPSPSMTGTYNRLTAPAHLQTERGTDIPDFCKICFTQPTSGSMVTGHHRRKRHEARHFAHDEVSGLMASTYRPTSESTHQDAIISPVSDRLLPASTLYGTPPEWLSARLPSRHEAWLCVSGENPGYP